MDALLAFEEEWLSTDETEAGADIDALLGTDMDERRLHLRAYDRWLAARDGDGCPTLAALAGTGADEFSGHSLLLDFTDHGRPPVLRHVGARLRRAFEPGGAGPTLLARLAACHPQIVESGMPVGFEAEIVDQGGASSLYRGILMPLAGEDGTISGLYGVINSKRLADNAATIALALEVDQALSEIPGFAGEQLWPAPAPVARLMPAPFAFA